MSHNTLYCSCKSYNYCFEWSSWVDEHFNKVTLEECPNCHDKLSLDLQAKSCDIIGLNFHIELFPQEPSEGLLKLLGPRVAIQTMSFSVPYIHLIMQYSACLLLTVLKVSNSADAKTMIYECRDLDTPEKHLTLAVSKSKIRIESNYDPTKVRDRLIKYGKLNTVQYEY